MTASCTASARGCWCGKSGNYYLIAYTDGRLKHYRVDKMRMSAPARHAREGADEVRQF